MKKAVNMIAAAGLLHDLGKFAERADAASPEDKDWIEQEFKYSHAGTTACWLQKLWGDDTVLSPIDSDNREINLHNLAARHHKPRNPFEMIVTEADCLAAGHERAAGESDERDGYSGKSRVPLHSIMERIALTEEPERKAKGLLSKNEFNSRYKLRPLRFGQEEKRPWEQEDFFPVHADRYPPEQVESDYKIMWQSFCEELTGGSKGNVLIDPVNDVDMIFHLMKKYTWCMPESTRYQDLPDVSLFDHCKATAALAVCMYRYHKANQNFDDSSIRNRSDDKYMIFCGDMAGIQKFIYNISSKGAYRSLKGRSFFVQIASEIIARYFIEKLVLPVTNILYASGGKFYLLLPNIDGIDVELQEIGNEVNAELYRKFGASLYLRSGFEKVNGKSFDGKNTDSNLCLVWDRLTRKVAVSDRRRYAGLMADRYDDFFAPTGQGGKTPSCDVCHEEAADSGADEQGRIRCSVCRQLEIFGRRLLKARYIAVSPRGAISPQSGTSGGVFLGRELFIEKAFPSSAPAGSIVYCLNNGDFLQSAENFSSAGRYSVVPLMLGGNHHFEQEFDAIAEQSRGIKRLGVLRMDIDNLGLVFAEGLQKYRYHKVFSDEDQFQKFNFHSLGRITTLSFQLSFFFGAAVQNIVDSGADSRDRVVIVYAGGDDLFMLGAWDALPECALEIKNGFSRFACQNPALTLSGGMVLTGGKFPVYKSADMAGEAEDRAKSLKVAFDDMGVCEKDAFSFFDEPMNWREFDEVKRLKDKITEASKEDMRPLIQRIRLIAASYRSSREELRRKSRLTGHQLDSLLKAERWRWRMIYALARLSESRSSLRVVIEDLKTFIMDPVRKSSRTGIDLLHILARWTELYTRH